MTARAVFVGGTSSNAGKSWMATALCAWLRRNGVAVAPFKAQNMSNNSYPCRGGGEIGRAQVAQAEACGLEPEPAMNPILLKPSGAHASQVVVNGRPWKTLEPRAYYEEIDQLRSTVAAAYDSLARRFDVIVIEGAGSVSELNLRHVDLANLGLATTLGAPWLLVADIERGGVFASVVGTVALLSQAERALFRGFAINKFRGDRSLFEPGVRLLEARTSAHCFGVFPHAPDISLDDEDSLARRAHRDPHPPGARIAIVTLPCISNTTDFKLLTWAEWIEAPSPDAFDFVILPGTKNTIADLIWLRRTGLADWMMDQYRRGATVIGVCGGFQMLGDWVRDPLAVESSHGSAEGLGLLPVATTLSREKTTVIRDAFTMGGRPFVAYEIHAGVTEVQGTVEPFASFADGGTDGACLHRVLGTYLHGAFENEEVCREVFGIAPARRRPQVEQYARLADWLDSHARDLSRLDIP